MAPLSSTTHPKVDDVDQELISGKALAVTMTNITRVIWTDASLKLKTELAAILDAGFASSTIDQSMVLWHLNVCADTHVV